MRVDGVPRVALGRARTRPAFGLAIGAALIWLAGCSGPRPVTPETVELARQGVSSNGQWAPAVREVEGVNMALVPAGCYQRGSTEQELEVAFDSCRRFYGAYASDHCGPDAFAAEQPAHRVCFEAPFWIDVHEVTNRAYGSSSSTDREAMYRAPNWPRETVSWEQAAAFCAGRGLRLPTEAEWEYAARGPDGVIYSWGDDFDPERVVMGRLSPEDVAARPAGVSWVAVHDLSGGIQEWTADWFGPYPGVAQVDPVGPDGGTQRVTRGGSWFSFAPFLVRAAHREPLDPEHASSTVGFRCAGDFEPEG